MCVYHAEKSHTVTKDLIARWLRYGFVITLHAFVEGLLKRICDVAASKKGVNLPRSPKTPEGEWKEMSRAEFYFTKHLYLQWPGKCVQLKELKGLRNLRNAIVHDDGRLLGDKRTAEISKHFDAKRLSEDEEGRVQITPKYCQPIVEAAVKFFTAIRQFNETTELF